MASLNKLAIRGIRSFDDKSIAVIEFFTPVTVIVGHNGSGKTTIIECLKYATTGDQPPNTRGGAFVHDPKMANEKEVKAQVKLRFHAANGTRMLAVRNLSVTAKKTAGLTMKTLEGILALADTGVEKGGKRGVISTKCAELDTEIPQLLGVSKSVLENVIFCHQEDSYWPLAEPSTLKKKFDDIFEATKYTKALDNIKALRKERVADLKAEKEHMEGLRREKGHADKLRNAIADLQATISAKETEYEETTKAYNALVLANAKFYEYSTKFMEKYQDIARQTKNIELFEEQIEDTKKTWQAELGGTEQDLKRERDNLAGTIEARKQRLKDEKGRLDDLEDELSALREHQKQLTSRQGELTGQMNGQKQRIENRDQLVLELGEKHGIKGYSVPLDAPKYLEFKSRLEDMSAKQKSAVTKLKNEDKAKQEQYTNKSLELRNIAAKHSADIKSSRSRVTEAQSKIKTFESQCERMESHSFDLETLKGDMEEKSKRLAGLGKVFDDAKYDEVIKEKNAAIQALDQRRDAVNGQLKALSSQGNSRAKLELKKGEVRTKNADVKHTVDSINAKYRTIKKKDVKPESVVGDVDLLLMESEEKLTQAEDEAASANQALQHGQANLTNAQSQLKRKQAELKVVEKELADGVDGSLDKALKDATEELDVLNSQKGTYLLYERLYRAGKKNHKCSLCSQNMDDKVFKAFEEFLLSSMKKASPESHEDDLQTIKEWTIELERLQGMIPVQNKVKELRDKEIPTLEKEIKKLDGEITEAGRKAQSADESVSGMKRQVRDAQALQGMAKNVARLQKEVAKLEEEIESLVDELSASGSTKTIDDVQSELDEISSQIQALNREVTKISGEKDQKLGVMHTIEKDIHRMQLGERDLQAKIKEKEDLQIHIESAKKDVIIYNAQAREAEVKLSEAQAPIDALTADYEIAQKALVAQINEAQAVAQGLIQSVDKLQMASTEIEKFQKQRIPAKLKDCESQLIQTDEQIEECTKSIAQLREQVSGIERDIGGADAKRANLQDNIRVRQLMSNIADAQKEISEFDLEEASRARRNFEEKYSGEKKKETNLHASCAHIQGELKSMQAQLKESNKDMKEYKDIDQKYTDQLVKVKMSDVANNDLELYAKALDNAIMKYHGLKMEEVNTTMRHLWNRTYQGTDIDGIKIRSDVEGGASKRSYNYRVVMTKDQVEMDMRGRCSAGQKMLASIIIRLALSDSFGQNCGILALDEPTNALDRENIDALASSLVDIIEERKSQSNFQLIIITHDETFLAKLGQNNVMQHYWRVTRDARQKSIIERQNFGV